MQGNCAATGSRWSGRHGQDGSSSSPSSTPQWFTLAEGRVKILKGQAVFLGRLLEVMVEAAKHRAGSFRQ